MKVRINGVLMDSQNDLTIQQWKKAGLEDVTEAPTKKATRKKVEKTTEPEE